MIYHNSQTTNNEDTPYLMPHSPHVVENMCVVLPLILWVLLNIEP